MKKLGFVFMMLFIMLLTTVSAGVEILDPKDGAVLTRGIDEGIVFNVKVEGAYNDCSYSHLNTPDIDIPFDCIGQSEIYSDIVFFGKHTFKVIARGQYGVEKQDTITFTVNNGEINSQKATSVNLDTLFCVEGANCLWDEDAFLELVLLIGIGVLIFFFLKEGKK